MGLSLLGKSQASIGQPKNMEIERRRKKELLQCLLSDLINTTELIVEIRPEKISRSTGFEPMTSAIPVQALPIGPLQLEVTCLDTR